MANILTVGNTSAQSTDFTLAGESSSLFLVANQTGSVDSGSVVLIEIKSASGFYYPVGRLDAATPLQVLIGPGTYRVNRPAQTANVGVDRV